MQKTDSADKWQQDIYKLINEQMRETAESSDLMPARDIEDEFRSCIDESIDDLETTKLIIQKETECGIWYGWVEKAIKAAVQSAAWLLILQGRKYGTEAENQKSDSAVKRTGNQ